MQTRSYKTLYILWAMLFVLTAGLSFVPNPTGIALLALRVLAVAYFLPPWLLLLLARRDGAYVHTRRIRRIAAGWLVLALVLLCANIASVNASEGVGTALHALMAVVCAPLACGDYYALPLFFYATLLIGAKSKPIQKP